MAITFICVECKKEEVIQSDNYMEAGDEMKTGNGWVYLMDGWHCVTCITKTREEADAWEKKRNEDSTQEQGSPESSPEAM